MNKLKVVPTVFLIALFTAISGHASEVRGSFWGYKGAKIPEGSVMDVSCGNFNKDSPIKSNGSYSIRGLPSSSGCSYRVSYPDGSASKSISFHSGHGVIQINGELRKHKNRILVVPK